MKPITLYHVSTCKNLGSQRGLTLVEVMIAITISLVLLTGVMQIFTGSRQTYRVQDNMARVQENGRFAMDFLKKNLRMADHWGCMRNTAMLTNNLNGSVGVGTTAGLTGTNGLANAPDTITLATATSSGITVTGTMPTSSAVINTSPHTLAVNDIVIISNCTNGDVFQVTHLPGTGIGHNSGAGTPGNTFSNPSSSCPGAATNCLSADYGPGAEVLSFQTVTYSIALDPANNSIPTLFQAVGGAAPQALVEGVEDMQILYGEDTDLRVPNAPLTVANLTADRYVPAGTAGLVMNNVVSIRIGLVLRTAENNLAITPQVYTNLQGVTTTAADRRLRRVFSSTIQLRNRV